MLKGLTFALLFAPFFLFAQADFRKGYVINNDGDTIKGYINVRSWDNNPEAINFKASANDNARKLGVDDVQYFAVGGVASYRRYTVRISLGEVKLDRMPSSADTSATEATVFLKTECTGDLVDLYSYSDKIKTRYYISENRQLVPSELIYVVYSSDGGKMNTIRSYIGQLLRLAEKFGKLTDEARENIVKADYERSDLKKICTSLNNYILPESKRENETLAKIQSSYFFAGITANMQKLSYSGDNSLASGSSKITPLPSLTFGLAAFPNRVTKRLGFIVAMNIEFNKTKITGGGPYENAYYNIYYSTAEHDISQVNLAFSPGFIYNLYNKSALKWFAGVSMDTHYSFYPENKMVNTRISRSDGTIVNRTEEEDPIKLEKLWMSFPIRTGLCFNQKITAFAQYVPASAITKYTYYSVAVSGFSAGIEYNFLRKK